MKGFCKGKAERKTLIETFCSLRYLKTKHLKNEDTNDLQQLLTEMKKENEMKSKMLGSSLVIGLAFLVVVVSAQAQTIGTYRAHIPFDFSIGNESYEAGEYVINLKSPNYLATILTVRDEKGKQLQASAVMKNGSTSRNEKTSLVFNRYGNKYVLRKIVAPGFGFSAPKSKVVTRISKKDGKPTEIVSVILSRSNSNMD